MQQSTGRDGFYTVDSDGADLKQSPQSEPLEHSGQTAQIKNENCRLPQKHAIIATWESWSGNRSMTWLVEHSH